MSRRPSRRPARDDSDDSEALRPSGSRTESDDIAERSSASQNPRGSDDSEERRSSGGRDAKRPGDRGQVVLLAAATVAVALLAMGLAYASLGYDADVAASGDADAPGERLDRALDRAVHGATAPTAGEYGWDRRRPAAAAVERRLDDGLARIEAARLDRGTVVRVGYNASAADAWATERCPGGPDRRFGPCRAIGGVVVQERAGETHALAVALDVELTADRGRLRANATRVYRSVGRR